MVAHREFDALGTAYGTGCRIDLECRKRLRKIVECECYFITHQFAYRVVDSNTCNHLSNVFVGNFADRIDEVCDIECKDVVEVLGALLVCSCHADDVLVSVVHGRCFRETDYSCRIVNSDSDGICRAH